LSWLQAPLEEPEMEVLEMEASEMAVPKIKALKLRL